MPSGEMDPVYSIGVNNRFIGIDNDMIDDPLELIRAAQEKPKKEKDVKPVKGKKDSKPVKVFKEKPKVESSVVSEAAENKKSDGQRFDRGRGGRGRGRGGRGRGGDRGGRGARGGGRFNSGEDSYNDNSGGFGDNNQMNRGGFGNRDGQSERYTGGFGNENDEDRRGGRSGFRPRGGRGGRGRGRGGNREFDRRSGSDKTSVKAFDKRDGSGSYNWGTPQDELAASEEQPQQQNGGGFGAPPEDDAPTETVETNAEAEDSSEEKKEEEPPQMTFDEYKKQQDENRSKPQFNLRRVENEKKLKQLKKPTEEDNEADGSLFFPKKYYEEKLKTSGRVKEHVNVDFHYSAGDNRHMDSGRRGRGGRGGRGNRSGRKDDGMRKSAQIALENTEEFPSLG